MFAGAASARLALSFGWRVVGLMGKRNYSARRKRAPRAVGRAVAASIELMREQPVFEVPDADRDKGAAPAVNEGERERQWELETLQLFRRRTLLITSASMLSLPFFWLIFSHFAPQSRWTMGASHSLMFGCCLTLNVAARRCTRLLPMRLISLSAYLVYGATASVVMWLASELRVITFSGHQHILLSILFLPFTVPETIICGVAVAGTYAWSLFYALPPELSFTLPGHAFSLFFLAGIIVILNYLQNQARRRAFDVSFDMALSAGKGAALSTLDEVTGGYNRRHLMKMIELELERMQRFERPLGVVMFDLDNFKRVNDTNGHLAGDEVLREVLKSASAALRGIDTIARYGGDEFVIILPDAATDAAEQTAHRVRAQVLASLRHCFPVGSLESLVTLSVGVASFRAHTSPHAEEIIERADAQLYKAKRAGKDRIYVETAN